MEEPTKEWVDEVNRDMASCVLENIKETLEKFGVPRTAFADDQFYNFVAMYNRRGDQLGALRLEIDALREQQSNMEGVLVEIANWPNSEQHPQMQAMKVWAASVLDPAKVNMMKGLTTA